MSSESVSWAAPLKDIRTRLGWTRRKLAEYAGCSPASIAAWESGKRIPGRWPREYFEELERDILKGNEPRTFLKVLEDSVAPYDRAYEEYLKARAGGGAP